jgi:protein SCO1
MAAAIFFMTVLGVFCVGCETAPVENHDQTQARRFSLKGKIISIDKPTREILVDHEAIPGFMGAMEMPYPVKDAKSLDQLFPGDEIRADVVVTDGKPVLENIVVTKKASGA